MASRSGPAGALAPLALLLLSAHGVLAGPYPIGAASGSGVSLQGVFQGGSFSDAAGALAAQRADAVVEAERLRNAGNLAEAVRLLRVHLGEHPDDGDAARLLAQTLYWQKDFDGAREAYLAALRRHPEDTALRLQHGRMLMEIRDDAGARAVLTPLQQFPGTRAEVTGLLGTLAYWRGELGSARRLLREALRLDPTLAEPRQHLRDIYAGSAPWLDTAVALRHDDQPLDRGAIAVNAGWFLTPQMSAAVRVEPAVYRVESQAGRQFAAAEAGVSGFAETIGLETELAGGILQRAGTGQVAQWQGRGAVGLRPAPFVSLQVRAERTAYLWTSSSVETPVTTRSATALFRLRETRGWTGETAYQRQAFPDANVVTTAYGWVLAPVLRDEQHGQLQLGYSVSRSTSDASRFVLARPVQPFPPTDTRFDTSGKYVPYYTPADQVIHSAIGAIVIHPSPRSTVRLGGAYALRAHDLAPALTVSGGKVTPTAYPRDFSPWNGRASLELSSAGGLTLTAASELSRTADYSSATVDLHLTYRFRVWAIRRANAY